MVEVVVPEARNPESLATTLASLASQRYPAFSVASVGPPGEVASSPIPGIAAILEARGHPVRLTDVPATATPGRRRQAFLEAVAAPYLLVLDDGVFLEPDLLGRLVAAIRATRCGFVGSSVIDLRYRGDHRPDEEEIEFWDGPVRPEDVKVGSPAWARRRVHRGANLEHLRERLPRTRDRLYRIADIRGCVLYEAATLRAGGGFEALGRGQEGGPLSLEATAQLRLLAHAGGAGLFPSGAYRVISGASELARNPATRVDDMPAAPSPRRIGRGHHGRRAATAHAAHRSRGGQIRAPGPPRHRMATRAAGGPGEG
jgi:hypothetical protein